MHVGLIPRLGIEPGAPALGAWSLNHCATREAPKCLNFLCNVSIFLFMVIAFCVFSKKPFSTPKSVRYSPIFSSKSLMILAFTFRSVIHFEYYYEFICLCWEEGVELHFFSHYEYPVVIDHMLKRLSFSY